MVKSIKNIQQKEGQRIGLFGASGCGKTTKARRLLANCKRLIIFDSVKNEWVVNGRKWINRSVLVVNSTQEFIRVFTKKFTMPNFVIIFKPVYGSETSQLDELCKVLFNAQSNFGITHNATLTLFIEEAQESIPSGLARENPKHYALLLARMGRAKGINLVIASQRIKTVDITFRANLSCYYIFRLAELSDIKEANQYVHNIDALMKLPNLCYFFIGNTGEITKRQLF